ncbi:hypothetical protein PYCC9005_002985 [Savitreella phatthalungensis]
MSQFSTTEYLLVVSGLTAASGGLTVIRLILRVQQTGFWRWDDFFIVPAWICALIIAITTSYGTRALLEVDVDWEIVTRFSFVSTISLYGGLGLAQLSVATVWRQLASDFSKHYRLACDAVLIECALGTLAEIIVHSCLCGPARVFWAPDLTDTCLHNATNVALLAYAPQIFRSQLDLTLMILPLPALLHCTTLKRREKSALALLVLFALLVIAACLRRLVASLPNDEIDLETFSGLVSACINHWTAVEINVAIICANAIGVRQPIMDFLGRWRIRRNAHQSKPLISHPTAVYDSIDTIATREPGGTWRSLFGSQLYSSPDVWRGDLERTWRSNQTGDEKNQGSFRSNLSKPLPARPPSLRGPPLAAPSSASSGPRQLGDDATGPIKPTSTTIHRPPPIVVPASKFSMSIASPAEPRSGFSMSVASPVEPRSGFSISTASPVEPRSKFSMSHPSSPTALFTPSRNTISKPSSKHSTSSDVDTANGTANDLETASNERNSAISLRPLSAITDPIQQRRSRPTALFLQPHVICETIAEEPSPNGARGESTNIPKRLSIFDTQRLQDELDRAIASIQLGPVSTNLQNPPPALRPKLKQKWLPSPKRGRFARHRHEASSGSTTLGSPSAAATSESCSSPVLQTSKNSVAEAHCTRVTDSSYRTFLKPGRRPDVNQTYKANGKASALLGLTINAIRKDKTKGKARARDGELPVQLINSRDIRTAETASSFEAGPAPELPATSHDFLASVVADSVEKCARRNAVTAQAVEAEASARLDDSGIVSGAQKLEVPKIRPSSSHYGSQYGPPPSTRFTLHLRARESASASLVEPSSEEKLTTESSDSQHQRPSNASPPELHIFKQPQSAATAAVVPARTSRPPALPPKSLHRRSKSWGTGGTHAVSRKHFPQHGGLTRADIAAWKEDVLTWQQQQPVPHQMPPPRPPRSAGVQDSSRTFDTL